MVTVESIESKANLGAHKTESPAAPIPTLRLNFGKEVEGSPFIPQTEQGISAINSIIPLVSYLASHAGRYLPAQPYTLTPQELISKAGIVEKVDQITELAQSCFEPSNSIAQPEHLLTLNSSPKEESMELPIETEDQVRFMNQWARVTAHDIRQPVTSIKGYSQLLARKPDFSSYPKLREIILSSCQRAEEIMTERVQRLPEGLMLTNFVDLRHIAVTAMEQMAYLTKNGMDPKFLTYSVDESVPKDTKAYLPKPLLTALLYEIADNTAKRARLGVVDSPTQFQVLVRASDDKSFLEIVCQDDGPGHPENVKELGFIAARQAKLRLEHQESYSPDEFTPQTLVGSGFIMAYLAQEAQRFGVVISPRDRGDGQRGACTTIRIPVIQDAQA